MAVNSSSNFSLPIDELIEEAFLRLGGDPVLGNELRTAKRTLDLLFTDMQNRGILLYTIEQDTQTLTAGDADYTLDTDTLDIVEMVYRNTSASPDQDLSMERISYQQYMQIGQKLQTGTRPSQWTLDRQRAAPVLYVYPAPNSTAVSQGELVYWRVRFTRNSTNAADDPDAPRRFWPALVSGMAYYLALKRPAITPDRVAMLLQTYEGDLQRAMDEDRDRAAASWIPYRRNF
jgi:hypothetical protein